VEDHIAIEKDWIEPPASVEDSTMAVNTLAPGFYQVGKEDYSAIAEHEGNYIAINAYAGIKERYDALVAETGMALPMKFMIVTHHHSGHMDGIDETVEKGS